MASGLLSWFEHLADCELNRRAGEDFNLQPPHTVIPPRETTDTIIAATMYSRRICSASWEGAAPRNHAAR